MLLPRDRVRGAARFREHRNEGRQAREIRTAAFVAVGARGAIENGAYDFQTTIDCRSRYAASNAIGDEWLQRSVMDSIEFERSDIRRESSEGKDLNAMAVRESRSRPQLLPVAL